LICTCQAKRVPPGTLPFARTATVPLPAEIDVTSARAVLARLLPALPVYDSVADATSAQPGPR